MGDPDNSLSHIPQRQEGEASCESLHQGLLLLRNTDNELSAATLTGHPMTTASSSSVYSPPAVPAAARAGPSLRGWPRQLVVYRPAGTRGAPERGAAWRSTASRCFATPTTSCRCHPRLRAGDKRKSPRFRCAVVSLWFYGRFQMTTTTRRHNEKTTRMYSCQEAQWPPPAQGRLFLPEPRTLTPTPTPPKKFFPPKKLPLEIEPVDSG